MTWWLWILFGAALFTAAWFGGLLYADVMMRRGQSSFFGESTAQSKRVKFSELQPLWQCSIPVKQPANHQQRIEALEHQNTRLNHIANLADRLVNNAWPNEEAFNSETYTVVGDDLARLSAALVELEFEEATDGN